MKIPEGKYKTRIKEKDGVEYVQMLAGRRYDPDKQYNIPEWVNIGKQIPEMPGLMYPSSNYFQYYDGETEKMNETMTDEEKAYTRYSTLYERQTNFFEGLYNEFRQQTRRDPEGTVSAYKVEMINEILAPLKEMMKGEEYAGYLKLIEEENMRNGDVMMLLAKYKSALKEYRRGHDG